MIKFTPLIQLFIKILVFLCPSFSFLSLLKHFIHFHLPPSALSHTVNLNGNLIQHTNLHAMPRPSSITQWRLFPDICNHFVVDKLTNTDFS